MSASEQITNTAMNPVNVPIARKRCVESRVTSFRLMDIATKTSPVRTAAEPPTVRKKSCHSSGLWRSGTGIAVPAILDPRDLVATRTVQPALRIAPELADPVGPLEVRKHQDVEQLGAGSGTERVETLKQFGARACPTSWRFGPCLPGWGDCHQATIRDECRSSHDRRFVAGKEEAARSDLLGCRRSLEGRVLGDVTVGIFRRDAPLLDERLHRVVAEGRHDPTGAQRVSPNAERPVI